MKKKSIAFLAGLLALCIYFGIAFTMSSFDKVDLEPDEPDLRCDVSLTRQIAINFDSPNNANWARTANHQGWIPSEDLRFGTTPGPILAVQNKWYAKVTVTSPQCSDFIFEYVLQTGSNVVSIQVPHADFDFFLEVDYWETFDAPYNPFDFNITPIVVGQTNAARLSHKFSFMFPGPWNSGVTQPINLSPYALHPDFDPWGGGKVPGIQDYTDANDFITNRGN